jgi:hypothetical protein
MFENTLDITADLPALGTMVQERRQGRAWSELSFNDKKAIYVAVDKLISTTLRRMTELERTNYREKYALLIRYQEQLKIWKENMNIEPAMGSGAVGQDTVSSAQNHGRSGDWKRYKG